MDINAVNFNPNASCSDNSCIYTLLPNPCNLQSNYLTNILTQQRDCLTKIGFEFLNKMRTGLSDDCSIMNHWKLVLINYLFNRQDLDCLYNCADGSTSNTPANTISCNSQWVTGGPNTGDNHDSTAAGFTYTSNGTGTEITNPNNFFVSGTYLAS